VLIVEMEGNQSNNIVKGMGMRLKRFSQHLILMIICVGMFFASGLAESNQEHSFNADLNYAQVEFVEIIQNSDGRWCIYTTVRHKDEGWKHYANAWDVIDQDGNPLTERILMHPHDNEQPFTRSQCGVLIPEDITLVIVRSKCNLHGFGGRTVEVDLTQAEGKYFKVQRADN